MTKELENIVCWWDVSIWNYAALSPCGRKWRLHLLSYKCEFTSKTGKKTGAIKGIINNTAPVSPKGSSQGFRIHWADFLAFSYHSITIIKIIPVFNFSERLETLYEFFADRRKKIDRMIYGFEDLKKIWIKWGGDETCISSKREEHYKIVIIYWKGQKS